VVAHALSAVLVSSEVRRMSVLPDWCSSLRRWWIRSIMVGRWFMLLLSLVLEIGGGDWVVMYLEFLGLWLGMGNTTDPFGCRGGMVIIRV